MVFSKHNFMIKIVIVFAIFYCNGLAVSAEIPNCMDSLKKDGFDKRTGFQNLAFKVAGLNIKDEHTDFNVTEATIDLIKDKITDFYKNDLQLSSYGISYLNDLVSLVKRPGRMLPPETFCEIQECYFLFAHPSIEGYLTNLRLYSLLVMEFRQQRNNRKLSNEYDKYIHDASLALGKSNKDTHGCTIKVCHETVMTPMTLPIISSRIYKRGEKKKEEKSYTIEPTGFSAMYHNSFKFVNAFFRRDPLTWCVIQACYTSLLKFGFNDVEAKLNREVIWYKPHMIPDIYSYADTFFEFINSPEKKAGPIYAGSNVPFINNQLYEYPINWCSVEGDLKSAGFKSDTFVENYQVLKHIESSLEKSIGKRIVQIVDTIVYNLFGQTIEYYISEYINRYIGQVGVSSNSYLNDDGKFIRYSVGQLMNLFIGDFIGLKVKQYMIKKCEHEETGKYLQYLFEKILMTDEKDILYQSEFVSKYCSHMHKLMFVTTRSEEDNEYYIPADREQRKPLEWCMITVMFEI